MRYAFESPPSASDTELFKVLIGTRELVDTSSERMNFQGKAAT